MSRLYILFVAPLISATTNSMQLTWCFRWDTLYNFFDLWTLWRMEINRRGNSFHRFRLTVDSNVTQLTTYNYKVCNLSLRFDRLTIWICTTEIINNFFIFPFFIFLFPQKTLKRATREINYWLKSLEMWKYYRNKCFSNMNILNYHVILLIQQLYDLLILFFNANTRRFVNFKLMQ